MVDVVKCLLSSGANIDFRNNLGQSPLCVASYHGHCDVVKNGDCPKLSRQSISAPELSKQITRSQCPPVDAPNNGDCPILLRKLISALELSKHLTTSEYPRSDATSNGDCRDNFGQSPLFVASYHGHCDVVKCLLSSGADINFRNNLGQSPHLYLHQN
jgi:ankyrin repeat protein